MFGEGTFALYQETKLFQIQYYFLLKSLGLFIFF